MALIYPQGTASVTLATNDKLAVFSASPVQIYKVANYPNFPQTANLVYTTADNELYVTAAASAATTYRIEGSAAEVQYETGTAATVKIVRGQVIQGDPVALNATGALTAAAILSGIVTSTTAAAVAGTVPTGAVMDAASDFAIGDAFDWAVITTGANAFTVTAAAEGHTLVGNAVVAAGKAGLFRTRKTAASTFVTYSLANT